MKDVKKQDHRSGTIGYQSRERQENKLEHLTTTWFTRVASSHYVVTVESTPPRHLLQKRIPPAAKM